MSESGNLPEVSSTHDRERQFHDQWAAGTPLERILVREAFESPVAVENQFILRKMGPLDGKRVLDVGAGLGESSVYFALKGAQVTASDLSPAMVECAVRLAEFHGVSIEGIVSKGEDLQLPSNTFDLVYCANTLHHVPDKDSLLAEIHRVLKPGGWFFMIDPMGYNPVIHGYRFMATKVRTEDERPLTYRDLRRVRRLFINVGHREFWISSLALYLKYYLVDGVHPNDERYWKRILRETPQSLRWWMPLRALDRFLTRLPLLRALAWNMVMYGEKPRS